MRLKSMVSGNQRRGYLFRPKLRLHTTKAGGAFVIVSGTDARPLVIPNRPLEAEYVAVGIIQVQLTHPVRSVLWGL